METTSEPRRPDVLERLARWLQSDRTSMGDLARLRRMVPEQPEPAFHVLRDLMGDGVLYSHPRHLRRWALLVHCLALSRGRHRRSAQPFGRALVAIRFGELRLQQLVRADFDVLADLLPRVARRFGAQNTEANWWPAARLVLNVSPDATEFVADGEQSQRAHPDPDVADEARREIVRDFVIASGAEAAAAN